MKAGDKTYYDGYWKNQVALTCDEKCRLRFIVSKMDAVARREAKAAINLGSKLDPSGPAPRLRIADVGCGRGWLTEELSRFGDAVGFDQSTVEAARRFPRLRFVECDVLDLRRALVELASRETRGAPTGREGSVTAAAFDVAVCSEVIEHVRREDQHRLVESIAGILRQEGTLIMTTPNRPVVTRVVETLGLQEELQPIEDWLDAVRLNELLAPQFDVQELTSLMFFSIIARRIGPLSRAYRLFYEQWGGYRFVDPLQGGTFKGMYLSIVARKRG